MVKKINDDKYEVTLNDIATDFTIIFSIDGPAWVFEGATTSTIKVGSKGSIVRIVGEFSYGEEEDFETDFPGILEMAAKELSENVIFW